MGAPADGPAGLFLTLPEPALFGFPPNPAPAALPPPNPASALPAPPPFTIPDYIFTAALDARVPLTIATTYAVTAKLLNLYNQSTGKKPWAISKTRSFFVFIVAHNVFLAVYSAWTFWGMLGALRRSVVNPLGPLGLAATADSFCKLNGPAGLGNALFYDDQAGLWQTYPGQHLADGVLTPSRSDAGRIWNEGLAFYGWIFYLSKFYEVLDTFIILAKGKLSSTLQTYHHAGAMMCMWAGMRYMAAPIWMFAFVNAGIHTMMYSYYTLTAFDIKVPVIVKRTLTTMQIMQFLVGAAYAMAHSFVTYHIPVPVGGASTVADGTSGGPASPSVAATVASGLLARLSGHRSGNNPVPSQEELVVQVPVQCVTTPGQTFAIWLNVLYLAPLTYLFVNFFVKSYLRRSSQESVRQKARGGRRLSNVTLAERAGWDAAKDIEREVYGEGGNRDADGITVRRPSNENGELTIKPRF